MKDWGFLTSFNLLDAAKVGFVNVLQSLRPLFAPAGGFSRARNLPSFYLWVLAKSAHLPLASKLIVGLLCW